ncbi:MAG TPA: hypothetical protein VF478_09360, partial [Anaerolineae bacterium]
EYHAGGLSVPGHVRQLMHGEATGVPHAVGGAPSEDDWRAEFRKAGLPTRRPRIADREVQIDKVYGAFQTAGLFVFDDLAELKEELTTYSRKLNDHDEPTEEIEDEADYHLHAALRYVVSEILAGRLVMTSGYIDVHNRSYATQGSASRPRVSQPVSSGRGLTAAEIDAILEAGLIEQNEP